MQPVQVGDEIAHVGVVHGGVRPCLPGGVGGGVAREDPDYVNGLHVPELRARRVDELAAEHEMQKLRHRVPSVYAGRSFTHARGESNAASWLNRRCR